MTIEQLTSPTTLAILVLFALAFVPFGVWFSLLRVLLAPLLRPAGLVVVAVVAAAVIHFN